MKEARMTPKALAGALTAALALMTASLPLMAADPLIWPWKSKLPPDPALVQLVSIEDLSAVINKTTPPTISITVNASAPTPNYSELQLAPRIGDPKDIIFAFDAKGRPSQDMSNQVVTPVSFTADYLEAPLDKIGVIEVHSQSNCKAFSLKDNKPTDCISQSSPQ
jgi:hypothetical protein